MRLTIISHGIEIQPDQIGKQECVSLRIPRAISYVEGVRGVLTAPHWSQWRRRHGEAGGRGMLRSLLRRPCDSPCDRSKQESVVRTGRLVSPVG